MTNRLTRFVARKVDRAVKDATPEHLARRHGESVPVWAVPKDLQPLANEIDCVFGNGKGGVDLSELARFRRETDLKIKEAKRFASTCPAESTFERDVLALVAGWEKKLVEADAIEATIREADTTLLREVAGMVKVESTDMLGTIAGRIGELLAKVQVNVSAGVGTGSSKR